ncbi:MAG TPA: RidA family protein [Blastocatellia bacterium]|nr:RidA family protein [Blastocatellia bacterium]
MGRIREKIRSLGHPFPDPQVFPNRNRAGAVLVGELLFISGHPPPPLPGVRIEGKIDRDLTEEEGYIAARACALNILATVEACIGDLDRVKRVVKLLGFVNSSPGFSRQFAVVDGASDLFLSLFGPDLVSTRSAVGVLELARGIPVEIEAIFQVEV